MLDAYRLGVKIFDSGFRPDFIVGLWRGGSAVGIVVQECLQYLGVKSDHISLRTSYRGVESYSQLVETVGAIRVHGTQYLLENMNANDALIIVDDVYSTGLNVKAVIDRLEKRCAATCRGIFVSPCHGTSPAKTKPAGIRITTCMQRNSG